MSEQIHRLVMAAAGTATGLVGLAGVGGVIPLHAVAWIAFIGGALTIVGNQIRVWWPAKTPPPTPTGTGPKGAS